MKKDFVLPKSITLKKEDFAGGVFCEVQFQHALECPIARALKRKYPNLNVRVLTSHIFVGDKVFQTKYIGYDVVKNAIDTMIAKEKDSIRIVLNH